MLLCATDDGMLKLRLMYYTLLSDDQHIFTSCNCVI
jgi:hypothetical protein